VEVPKEKVSIIQRFSLDNFHSQAEVTYLPPHPLSGPLFSAFLLLSRKIQLASEKF